MPDDFDQNLSEISRPVVHTPVHKKMLKKALLQSAHFSRNASRTPHMHKVRARVPHRGIAGIFSGVCLRAARLFNYLTTMPLKKTLPVGLMTVLVFTFFGQQYMAWQNTAYAREILHNTIERINSQSQNEHDEELLSAIEILEQAEQNGEVEYLGEETYSTPPGTNIPPRTYQKFRLTDEDLSHDLLIGVNSGAPDPMNKSGLIISIDAPLAQAMGSTADFQFDQNGTILNLDDIRQKLADPKLTKPWLKELVKRNNMDWFKRMEENWGTSFPAGVNALSDPFKQHVLQQLEPLMQDAEVLLGGFGGGYDPSRHEAIFKLHYYVLTGKQAERAQARANIQEAIDKLSHFNTDSAHMKTLILNKALQSLHLRTYIRENSYSFPYVGAGQDEELYIDLYPADQTEDAVRFTFRSEAIGIVPGKGEWFEIENNGGHLAHADELREKLRDPNLHDELVRFVIKNNNREQIENLKQTLFGMGKGTVGAGLSHQNAVQIANELEQILTDADVPVMEISLVPMEVFEQTGVDHTDNPNFLFSLGIYPLGVPDPAQARKTLEEVMAQLKSSVGKEAKLNFLQEMQKSRDLHFDGEKTLSNGTKVRLLSFTRDGKRIVVSFDMQKGEYEVVK